MDGTLQALPSHLKGLHVRLTVECHSHGSHSATMTGPFLQVVDAVQLFRQAATERGRWVLCEYSALDYEPACTVSEWD
jgi:hypothetical protein